MHVYVQEISEEEKLITSLKILDVFVITLETQAKVILLVLRLITVEMTLTSASSLIYATTNATMSLEAIIAPAQGDISFQPMVGHVLVSC